MWNPYDPLAPRTSKLLGAASILALLVLWSLVSGLGLIGPAKLPTPWAVAEAFSRLLWYEGDSVLLQATLWSSARVLIASLLVVVIGIPIGIFLGSSPKLNAFFSPLIDPFRSAPVVALLPILVMWFGIGELMKVIFLWIGAVVYLVPMVRDAVVAVPSTYYISARDIGATQWESVRIALVPMAMPRIADAVIAAVSIEWTYITVAEYVNAGSGLGQLIQNARRFSAMDQVFVGIIVIIGLALVTYKTMTWLKNQLYPWEVQQ